MSWAASIAAVAGGDHVERVGVGLDRVHDDRRRARPAERRVDHRDAEVAGVVERLGERPGRRARPGAPKTFTGRASRRGDARDADPFSRGAAIVPATWVPCVEACVSAVLSQLTKSQPRQSSTKPLPSSSTPLVSRPSPRSPGLPANWPARSGWVTSTPVSITATVAPAPCVRVHASSASMSASATPVWPFTHWPEFSRPYSEPMYGVGREAARRARRPRRRRRRGSR